MLKKTPFFVGSYTWFLIQNSVLSHAIITFFETRSKLNVARHKKLTLTKIKWRWIEGMSKMFVFPIDILEFQTNFILEIAKTISQKLELFPYTHKIDLLQCNWMKIPKKAIKLIQKITNMFYEFKGTI